MSESIDASDYIFKIIAVGEASVGKTSLAMRYATNRFEEDYRMTLGMNLVTKNVIISMDGIETTVQLSLWDTGGQIAFAPLLPMYYKGALGAIIVYDITKKITFDRVQKWIEEVQTHCNEIPLTIIGNKSDLKEQREVSEDEALETIKIITKKWKAPIFFYETSAKEDLSVNESFTQLATIILTAVMAQEDVEEPQFGTLV